MSLTSVIRIRSAVHCARLAPLSRRRCRIRSTRRSAISVGNGADRSIINSRYASSNTHVDDDLQLIWSIRRSIDKSINASISFDIFGVWNNPIILIQDLNFFKWNVCMYVYMYVARDFSSCVHRPVELYIPSCSSCVSKENVLLPGFRCGTFPKDSNARVLKRFNFWGPNTISWKLRYFHKNIVFQNFKIKVDEFDHF